MFNYNMRIKEITSKMFQEFVTVLQKNKLELIIPDDVDVKFNLKKRQIIFMVKKVKRVYRKKGSVIVDN